MADDLTTPIGRYHYAVKTHQMVTQMWAYIPFRPIKWWKAKREVDVRHELLQQALAQAEREEQL